MEIARNSWVDGDGYVNYPECSLDISTKQSPKKTGNIRKNFSKKLKKNFPNIFLQISPQA
jgi:hypothetical protein